MRRYKTIRTSGEHPEEEILTEDTIKYTYGVKTIEIGTPNDSDWPLDEPSFDDPLRPYYTHFTPLVVPVNAGEYVPQESK